MNYVTIILLSACLIACNSDPVFEKDYFERITNKAFPKKYKVLESFDNNEWLTGVVLSTEQSTLQQYVSEQGFEIVKDRNDVRFTSNSYLKKYKLDITANQNIYFIQHTSHNNNWSYVADINKGILWCEIIYKD